MQLHPPAGAEAVVSAARHSRLKPSRNVVVAGLRPIGALLPAVLAHLIRTSGRAVP